jgi:hypothetical protein
MKRSHFIFIFVLTLIATSVTFAKDSTCTDDKDKLTFISDCTGDMMAEVVNNGGHPDYDKIKAECRCVAINFAVENLAKKDCDYNSAVVRSMMNADKVKLKCR